MPNSHPAPNLLHGQRGRRGEVQTAATDHPHRRHSRPQTRGFTLLEVMITVAIVMILTTVGIGMSSDLIPRYRTRKAALTMATQMQQCRSLAVRTGRECSVWLIDYDSSLSDPDNNVGEYWV